MSDAFKLLPPFTWRGVQYPVLSRSAAFQHEGAQHKIQFRDGQYLDQLGAKNLTFNYTLAMREDIAKGPYKHLFSAGLVPLLYAMRDRSPGELYDPFYGKFRCVPMSFSDKSDVGKRDGTDVDVEFQYAPEFLRDDPSINENISGLGSLVSDAGALDAELTLKDWKQEPSPEGMTDILSAINGAGRQTLGQVDRVGAKLEDLALKLNKIEQTADKAENPQNWAFRNDVRSARDATLRLHKRVSENPGTKIVKITRRSATTVSAVAADLDMTVTELLRLNPLLARSPVIPAGTIITARVARL